MEKRETVQALAQQLARLREGMPPAAVMEVCGTHTQSVARSGLRQLLPSNLRLISSPGCPVCVTGGGTIARAIALARRPNTCVCTFGDMMRVPVRLAAAGGAVEDSLLRERGLGRDVRLVLSPMEVLDAARAEPEKDFVWFGVGFETTAPHTAALVRRARADGTANLAVLCAHKTMPAALEALLGGQKGSHVSALLCPGHVAAITGPQAFRFVPERLGMPAAVAGFEPEEILSALTAIAAMLRSGRPALRNMYPSAVRPEGNPAAQQLLRQVFEPCPAVWRGMGRIDGSGLRLRREYEEYDAERRFGPADAVTAAPEDEAGCRCGEILRGAAQPRDCPLFGTGCRPDSPRGPCMVSSEGACAAEYRYGAR